MLDPLHSPCLPVCQRPAAAGRMFSQCVRTLCLGWATLTTPPPPNPPPGARYATPTVHIGPSIGAKRLGFTLVGPQTLPGSLNALSAFQRFFTMSQAESLHPRRL